MPWNNNSSGNGGGPWGSGGGSNNNGNNPWGNGSGGGGGRGPGGGGGQEPDLDELVRRLQSWLRGSMGGGGGSGGSKGGKGGGGGIFGVIIGAGALIAVLLASVYQIGPGEAGVVQRFGEFDRTTGPGLRIKLPYPIETVQIEDVLQIRDITIGANSPQEGLMVTRDENIVDISFTVQWQIDSARVEDYVFNVRNQAIMVRAIAESAMREVVGTSDLEPIITGGRDEVAQRAEEILQQTLDNYEAGIAIVALNLQEASPPGNVIEAFQDVISADQDAERNALEATAYANRIVPEARGDAVRLLEEARAYREQVVAEAEGQAARFNSIYAEYVLAPEVTRQRMFLETMERVLGRSDLMIFDQSGAGNGAVPYLSLDTLGRSRGPVSEAAGSGQGG